MKLKLIGITTIIIFFIGCSNETEEIEQKSNLEFLDEFGFESVNNITNFGAVANGDSTSSIIEAIRTAQDNQYPIYIPRGTYFVTQTINVPSNVMIIGSGRESILKQANNLDYDPEIILNLDATSNTSLINFTIEGAYNLDPYYMKNDKPINDIPNIQLFNCDHIEIENLYIHRSFGDGIAIYNSENSKVKNCLITENKISGIKFQESNYLDINDNRVSYNQAYGIALLHHPNPYNSIENRYVSITGNTVSHNDQTGIWLPAYHDVNKVSHIDQPIGENFIISKNKVLLNKANGIGCQVSNSVVSDNICSENGDITNLDKHIFQGILVNATGVSITGNSVSKSTGVGIDLGGCSRVTCTGNTVIENHFIGIEINSCHTAIVSNNILGQNNIDSATQKIDKRCGIIVHNGTDHLGNPFPNGSVREVVISGNSFNQQVHNSDQTYGIRVENDGKIKNITITNNILPNSGIIDLSVPDLDHIKTSNNIVLDD